VLLLLARREGKGLVNLLPGLTVPGPIPSYFFDTAWTKVKWKPLKSWVNLLSRRC